MQCYCVTNFRQSLQLLNRPLPEPKGTEVLLKIRAAGVCHSDIHLWEGSYDLGNGRALTLQDRGVNLPLTLGHENVGSVAAVGPDAPAFDTTRNYLVYPWLGCGKCPACLAGEENHCMAPACIGIHRPGGYAEYLLIPHPRYLIDIGDLDPAQVAPYACSGLTTYSALRKIGAVTYRQHPIVIFGAGGLGLMALTVLRALEGFGAIVVDLDPVKRQAALDAGALATVDGNASDAVQQIMAAAGGKPVQAALDLVGAPSSTAQAFDVLTKGGKLVVVGLFGGASTWPLALIPLKAASIVGSYVGSLTELQELMALVRADKIAPIPVTRYPLPEADAVLTSLREGKVVGRAVLTVN